MSWCSEYCLITKATHRGVQALGRQLSADEEWSRPRVLLNADPLRRVFTGVGRYTRSLYSAIEDQNLAVVQYVCGRRVTAALPKQGRQNIGAYVPMWGRDLARRVYLYGRERQLARLLECRAYSVYHETDSFPQVVNTHTPIVMTIFDLSLITQKQRHPPDRVRHFERHFFERLDSVAHVVTISEFIKKEIVDILDFPPDRVTVIPLAAAEFFCPRPEGNVRRYLQNRQLPEPYLLSVATQEPRKNLEGLAKALALLPPDVTLVCAGWSGWMNEAFVAAIERLHLSKRVVRLGHVTDEELRFLYSGARALVYPSFYEGFGLPILEAMACGCPVICSDRASIPEVAGDAAILVDPADQTAIASAVHDIWTKDTLRQKLVRLGYERARKFSWSTTAKTTVQLMQRVAGQAA